MFDHFKLEAVHKHSTDYLTPLCFVSLCISVRNKKPFVPIKEHAVPVKFLQSFFGVLMIILNLAVTHSASCSIFSFGLGRSPVLLLLSCCLITILLNFLQLTIFCHSSSPPARYLNLVTFCLFSSYVPNPSHSSIFHTSLSARTSSLSPKVPIPLQNKGSSINENKPSEKLNKNLF